MTVETLTMPQPDSTAARWDLRLKGLTKKFGDDTVVDNLTLEIAHGEFLGLIGANGAGKSTTLKMLAGLLDQSHGTAEVLGVPIESLKPEDLSRIGYVPETHQVYPWMSISESIWFCERLNPRWNDETAEELLDLFQLDKRKKIKSLSKGMLAKLGLLLAISHDPELLILDEPMSGLDPIAREEFLEGVLRTVTDRDCTVILSSHSIDDVQKFSDSIALVHQGKLLAHRPMDRLLNRTRRIRFVVDDGTPPPTLDSTIRTQQNHREWLVTVAEFSTMMMERLHATPNVHNIEVQDLSLEDVYKDYVRGRRA